MGFYTRPSFSELEELGVDEKIPGVLEWLLQHLPGIELSPQMAAGLEEWVEGAAQLLSGA